MKRGDKMPYKVVSEISNTSGSTFATYEEFASWYYDETYPAIEMKLGELLNNNWAKFNNIEVTNTWDVDRQVAIKTKIYNDLNHYNEIDELHKAAGIARPLETIIEEVEI